MKKLFREITYVLAAMFCGAVSLVDSALIPVSAEDSTAIVDYTATDILDDLADVPVSEYPYDAEGVPEVIRFQEYCYSEKAFFDEYYGLYLYIYNPTEEAIRTDGRNVVNMATAYGADGEPSVYENVPLTFCDKTGNNRFYKFKLNAELLDMARSYAAAHDGDRRYDVVGIQLTHMTTEDRTYAKTYVFSGYAAGCGEDSDAESTLYCEVEGLETIELDVYHTNYRTGDYADRVCDDLQTAYFAVPNEYFEDYGGLQKIKAEWYEYKTNPILVTSDSNVYSALQSYVGQSISETGEEMDYRVLWEGSATLGDNIDLYEYGKMYGNWGEGVLNDYWESLLTTKVYDWSMAEKISRLDWLFLRTNVTSREEYAVTVAEVENYMQYYTDMYGGDGAKLNGYSESLFSNSIDAERVELLAPGETRGYICQEIDAGESQDLTLRKDQSWWDELWNGAKYEEKGLDPIIVLDDSIKNLSVDAFAELYYINPIKAETVYNNCLAMLSSGKKPVLFRFAVTDYYASTARFDSVKNSEMSSEDGYVAQMSMFLDFDVISLTFRNDAQEDVVIGVVANPIDIINDVSPSPDLPVSSPSIFDGLFSFVDGAQDAWRTVQTILGIVVVSMLAFGVLILIDRLRKNNGNGGG